MRGEIVVVSEKSSIFATDINLMAIKLTTVKLNMIGYEILR
jgi:hypothetical protein